jgi:hypothetical protein
MIEIKRGNGRNNATYKTPELYNYYKGFNPVSTISKAKYSKVLGEINEKIFDAIIMENFQLIMPYSLGKKRIKKCKIRLKLKANGDLDTSRLIPDWKATKNLWEKDEEAKVNKQLVYLTNAHTNGYKFHFFWNKTINRRLKVRNIGMMCFRATKTTRQLLAKGLKNPYLKLNYFE